MLAKFCRSIPAADNTTPRNIEQGIPGIKVAVSN
jgi:hypothetical protein